MGPTFSPHFLSSRIPMWRPPPRRTPNPLIHAASTPPLICAASPPPLRALPLRSASRVHTSEHRRPIQAPPLTVASGGASSCSLTGQPPPILGGRSDASGVSSADVTTRASLPPRCRRHATPRSPSPPTSTVVGSWRSPLGHTCRGSSCWMAPLHPAGTTRRRTCAARTPRWPSHSRR